MSRSMVFFLTIPLGQYHPNQQAEVGQGPLLRNNRTRRTMT
jgi:hypothetical protein